MFNRTNLVRGAAPALIGLLFLGTPTEAMLKMFGGKCCQPAQDEPKPQVRAPPRKRLKPAPRTWQEKLTKDFKHCMWLKLTDNSEGLATRYQTVNDLVPKHIVEDMKVGNKLFARMVIPIIRNQTSLGQTAGCSARGIRTHLLQDRITEVDEVIQRNVTKPVCYWDSRVYDSLVIFTSPLTLMNNGIYEAIFSVSSGFNTDFKGGSYFSYKVVLCRRPGGGYQMYYRESRGQSGECEFSVGYNKSDFEQARLDAERAREAAERAAEENADAMQAIEHGVLSGGFTGDLNEDQK